MDRNVFRMHHPMAGCRVSEQGPIHFTSLSFSPSTVWDQHQACQLQIPRKSVWWFFSEYHATFYSPASWTQRARAPRRPAASLRRTRWMRRLVEEQLQTHYSGVLFHLCTTYWHFLAAVCFANVVSHRIKWGAVPEKPHNLAGSGTELSGNPQDNSAWTLAGN